MPNKKETGKSAASTASKGLRTGNLTKPETRKVSGSDLSQRGTKKR